MDILDDLGKVNRLHGDTYSSAEVLTILGRAETEIGRLRSMLDWIGIYTDMTSIAEDRFGPIWPKPVSNHQ